MNKEEAYIQRIIERIADKQKILTNFLGAFDKCEKRSKGLEKAALTLLSNDNEENTRKMLNTTMNIVKDQMDINMNLLSVLLVLVSDDDFKMKQGNFAIKTGHATQKDIVQSMFQDKLRGFDK